MKQHRMKVRPAKVAGAWVVELDILTAPGKWQEETLHTTRIDMLYVDGTKENIWLRKHIAMETSGVLPGVSYN